MWGLEPARVQLLAIAAVAVFAAGLIGGAAGTWWGLAAPRILAAHQSGQAALSALREDYKGKLADGEKARADAIQAEQTKAEEADRAYQAELDRIQREAAARPSRVVRVRVPGTCPVPAAAADPAGDPGQPRGPAADGPGVGPDAPGGYRDLDLRPVEMIIDRAKAVSAQLRALQGVCAP